MFSVCKANSTNTFKRTLDTYWQDQEIIYDFHAQLQGTGSHSDVFRYDSMTIGLRLLFRYVYIYVSCQANRENIL